MATIWVETCRRCSVFLSILHSVVFDSRQLLNCEITQRYGQYKYKVSVICLFYIDEWTFDLEFSFIVLHLLQRNMLPPSSGYEWIQSKWLCSDGEDVGLIHMQVTSLSHGTGWRDGSWLGLMWAVMWGHLLDCSNSRHSSVQDSVTCNDCTQNDVNPSYLQIQLIRVLI
jgi:hypothetical protein